jgi:hypothetical protein
MGQTFRAIAATLICAMASRPAPQGLAIAVNKVYLRRNPMSNPNRERYPL